jgi:hypothetical protein
MRLYKVILISVVYLNFKVKLSSETAVRLLNLVFKKCSTSEQLSGNSSGTFELFKGCESHGQLSLIAFSYCLSPLLLMVTLIFRLSFDIADSLLIFDKALKIFS